MNNVTFIFGVNSLLRQKCLSLPPSRLQAFNGYFTVIIQELFIFSFGSDVSHFFRYILVSDGYHGVDISVQCFIWSRVQRHYHRHNATY
jgi:hypothetical protein